MGISHSTPAMENRPEQEERMEEAPESGAEANREESSAGVEPSAGTMELQQGGEDEAPAASRRHTEVLALPKVDRGAAPATPAIRPGETSTPATGTKSKTERKQEKKAARKEEKRNKRAEKSARKAEKAEAEKSKETPSKTPVRRKLDAAMENAGSIESALLLEREYKALQRDPSHRPNFYFLIDRLISNLRHMPRTVFGPAAGEEERVKLTKLREEEAEEAEAAQPAAAGMEEVDEGSASRKRKLDELEQKKRALEEENAKKQKELEDEAKRIRAVEEAERRAREQRSKNPKLQVPVAAEKAEKGETWFERKATELVESYIQAYGPQQKKSKEAAATYAAACKDTERAQENFISALQKTQESAEQPQKSMGKALECAIEFGREEERTRLYTQAKEKCSRPLVPRVKARPQIPAGLQEKLRQGKAQKEEEASKSGKKEETGKPTSSQPGPFWGPHARVQPAEEAGKEWREKVYEDTWKAGRTIRSDGEYLQCTYYLFSPEWQEKVRKELLDLAHRGFATNSDGELYPTRKFAWQLQSYREFMDINNSLQKDYGIRLVWKSQEVKGKSKSVDDWHCYPSGFTQLSHSRITAQSAARFAKSTQTSTRMRRCDTLKNILKSNLLKMNVENALYCLQKEHSRMLRRRKQRSLRIQNRVWRAILKPSWKCRIRPRKDERSCLRRKASRRQSMWTKKVLARKKNPLVRKLEAKAKEAKVVSGRRSHFPQDIGRIVHDTNPFPRTARKPKKLSGRRWKTSRRNSLKNTTRRSCVTPSRSTSVARKPKAMPQQPQPLGAKKKDRKQRKVPNQIETGSDPSSDEESESSSSAMQ